ncbi:chitin synthase-domain-containing protein [Mycena maculata]|uniref:Chitin synthase-domain-containing protein n=1 Tax=Mycena maculata TaxID=230809 RepID=A0AAD7JGT2_9AGAR|nr:chitin synthase-domain-containing protein [Mycena maculata]
MFMSKEVNGGKLCIAEIYQPRPNIHPCTYSFPRDRPRLPFIYVFMMDANTTVDQLSDERPISSNKKHLGVCGETELANVKQSLITMVQVYQYFLSHNMAKAFELLFGSVTCLPSCFALYRLRTSDHNLPSSPSFQLLLADNDLIGDKLHAMEQHPCSAEARLQTAPLARTPPTPRSQ